MTFPRPIIACPQPYPTDGRARQQLRDGVQFGDVYVSIQASRDHLCSPREDGHDLDYYERLEVAIYEPSRKRYVRPGHIGMKGWGEYWGKREPGVGGVAGYMPKAAVHALLRALRAREIRLKTGQR